MMLLMSDATRVIPRPVSSKLTGRGIALVACDISGIIENIMQESLRERAWTISSLRKKTALGQQSSSFVSPSVHLADETRDTRAARSAVAWNASGELAERCAPKLRRHWRAKTPAPPSARGKLPAFES